MKRFSALLTLTLLTALVSLAFAQQVILPEKAGRYVGQRKTVCGKVVSTLYAAHTKGHPTLLSLGRLPANQLFTVLIWGVDRNKFKRPPETLYSGKTICVTGTITNYHGKPQIVVKLPGQIILASEEGSCSVPSSGKEITTPSAPVSKHGLAGGRGPVDHFSRGFKYSNGARSQHHATHPAPPQTTPAAKPQKPQPPPGDPFAAIDRILKNLEYGNIAFNTPGVINLDNTATIQLVLGLGTPIDELKQLIEKSVGKKEGARIRVSNSMEARLSGSNFSITAVTPEEQAVARSSITKWEWEVKPIAVGVQKLHLTLSAIIDVNGTHIKKSIKTFDRQIDVKVPRGQKVASFFKNNWQWLWAALLVPAFAWLKRRKKRSSHSPDT